MVIQKREQLKKKAKPSASSPAPIDRFKTQPNWAEWPTVVGAMLRTVDNTILAQRVAGAPPLPVDVYERVVPKTMQAVVSLEHLPSFPVHSEVVDVDRVITANDDGWECLICRKGFAGGILKQVYRHLASRGHIRNLENFGRTAANSPLDGALMPKKPFKCSAKACRKTFSTAGSRTNHSKFCKHVRAEGQQPQNVASEAAAPLQSEDSATRITI